MRGEPTSASASETAPLQPLPREVLSGAAPLPAAPSAPAVVDAPKARAVELPTGRVRIVTVPDTTVWVEGGTLGKQPLTVELPAGRNTLVFENAAVGLKALVRLDVAPGDNGTLKRTFGRALLRIDVPKGGRVVIDGRPAGGSGPFSVWEGLHTVELKEGGRRLVQSVEVGAGDMADVTFAGEEPRQRDERR
jgi:hypothetical protein